MKTSLFLILAAVAMFSPKSESLPLVWFGDELPNDVQNWSWASHDLAATSPVHGGTRSIRMEPDGWAGLYFTTPDAAHRLADYRALTFWVRGNGAGNQVLQVQLTFNTLAIASLPVNAHITGNAISGSTWRQVTIPFDASTTLTHGAFDGLIIADGSGANQAPVWIDDIVFEERTTPLAAGSATVTVDFAGARRAIDPEIYGVNFADDAQHADLRYPLRRWGGNSTTRYNWQSDSHNTAFDYFYQNIADGSGNGLPDASGANQFIDTTRVHGGNTVLTIGTIGWRPLGDRVKRWGFSITKYGPQDSNECAIYQPNPPPWCSADAGNGTCANVTNATGHCVGGLIVDNEPTDTSVSTDNVDGTIGTTWTTGWIQHLVARHGNAGGNGVRYYALDNEPMLWNSTHRDIHPVPPTYDEVWARGLANARAIKAVDAQARVLGPVTWGWCDLFTSAADAAIGPSCLTGPDREAHDGLPFAEWYIREVCRDAATAGSRAIDYFDAHFYPQGDVSGLGGNSDSELPADAARRLRSLRELYDPTYVSESWVGADGSRPQLIPRLRGWIASRCAGMKLALTEYKWGPDDGASGALAQAEALAIFGREGLDMAARWVAPEPGTLAERAFRLFLDYDATNTRVVGDSVATSTNAIDDIGAYTIEDVAGGRVFVVVINRATAPRAVTVNFSQALAGTWRLFRFDAATPVSQVATGAIAGAALALPVLPGRSANLVVLPPRGAGPPGDTVFANGFE